MRWLVVSEHLVLDDLITETSALAVGEVPSHFARNSLVGDKLASRATWDTIIGSLRRKSGLPRCNVRVLNVTTE